MDNPQIPAGIPLLSRNIPQDNISDRTESSCRRCDKEFNLLFARPKKCNHCGYAFCSSCSDYQALMPRDTENGQPGYDVVPVCAFCIEMLNITAAHKPKLRDMPLSKLRAYMKAYNINSRGIVEKNDLIDRILNTREPNGCLPAANEDFYRKHSVPDRSTEHPSASARARNFFSRATGVGLNNGEPPRVPPRSPTAPPPPSRPQQSTRPPPPPQNNNQSRSTPYSYHRQQQNPPPPPPSQFPGWVPQGPPPPPQPPQFPNSYPSPFGPPPPPPPPPHPSFFPHSYPPPPPPPQHTRPQPPPPQPPQQSTSRAPTTQTPAPTLEQLLTYSPEDISKLSIHSLKSILFTNHVNARLVVEKSELIDKVSTLIEVERNEREIARQRQEEEEREMRERIEREDQERVGRQHQMMEDLKARDGEAAPSPPSKPTESNYSERTGLCVICQDEDANIAIVDCGHLCLCRGCSEVVMSSSRECPMCRTRIVTESRLLRIFKT